MKTRTWKNRISIIATVLLVLGLMVAVVFLMSYVQTLLNRDVKINLTEVVTQNKDVIISKLNVEIKNIEVVSSQIEDRLKRDELNSVSLDERMFAIFRNYCEDTEDTRSYIANVAGKAFFLNGTTLDIGGRPYFKTAVNGSKNISNRTTSWLDGREIFVISVPLYLGDKIIGTVQKPYSPEQMYEICKISLFSSQGYLNIIDSSGYIMLSSENTDYNSESDNYYHVLTLKKNEKNAKILEEKIKNQEGGFLEMQLDGDKIYSVYTPLEEIHDWYLICSISTNAISSNSTTVIQIFYVLLISLVLIFGAISFYVWFSKNKQQAALEKIAFVDEITQGNTFSKFTIEVERILNNADDKQYGLVVFDIDNFKYINSFYGFAYGDNILKQIYNHINECLNCSEILARMTGDHFVMLVNDIDETRLCDIIDIPFMTDGVSIYLTAGLYVINDSKESVKLMVDKAGTAARSVKGLLNKKVALYSEKYDKQLADNEQLKRAIELAIARREIIPYYQPKVDIYTGKLVGAEALARWKTSDGNLISPGQFIPISEKTGQIIDIDLLVFEQVLQYLKKNIELGIECVPISVNFSRLHLMKPNFVHTLLDRIDKFNVPAYLIEVELTESIIFENLDVIIDFVNHLHEHGMLVSMDDFGSGYSSLNVLKDIPVDVLKIDRAFLNDTSNPERQKCILSTIVLMAEKLNMKIVVEGIETTANISLMKCIGCSIAQGYYYARPMDEDSFEQIFTRGSL